MKKNLIRLETKMLYFKWERGLSGELGENAHSRAFESVRYLDIYSIKSEIKAIILI
jgi:hypothetical protein